MSVKVIGIIVSILVVILIILFFLWLLKKGSFGTGTTLVTSLVAILVLILTPIFGTMSSFISDVIKESLNQEKEHEQKKEQSINNLKSQITAIGETRSAIDRFVHKFDNEYKKAEVIGNVVMEDSDPPFTRKNVEFIIDELHKATPTQDVLEDGREDTIQHARTLSPPLYDATQQFLDLVLKYNSDRKDLIENYKLYYLDVHVNYNEKPAIFDQLVDIKADYEKQYVYLNEILTRSEDELNNKYNKINSLNN